MKSAQNFGCCMWLQIDPEDPYSQGGYVAIIRAGGATVRATNLEEMKRAINDIDHVRRGDKLPVGLLTDYPVIPIARPGSKSKTGANGG